MIYKYCRRCGKLLKSEEARLLGYGEICYQRAHARTHKTPLIQPPIEQTSKEIKRLRAEEEKSRARAEQAKRARQRLESEQRGKEGAKSRKSLTPKDPLLKA